MYVETYYTDIQFKKIQGIMPGKSTLNTTAAPEYTPETERQIRGIKECAQAICITLPFNKILGRIVIEMIICVVLWLYAFLPISGISQTYPPRTIITNHNLDYLKYCRVEFGIFTEIHEDASPTNTMDEIPQGTIFLDPDTSSQGSCKFLSLRAAL